MAEFKTTRGIMASLEEIIIRADTKLVLISPFFQVSENFYTRLVRCCEKDIEVTIVYGKDRLNHQEWDKISNLNNVELRYYENLHAKCYYNEKQLLLGSMNFFEYSERNIEMGILVDSIQDKILYDNAVNEAETLISISDEKLASKKTNPFQKNNNLNQTIRENINLGSCIRCSTEISWNIDRPLCYKCYKRWEQYSDVEYPEKNCHTCGRPSNVSVVKPQCNGCYQKNRLVPDIY